MMVGLFTSILLVLVFAVEVPTGNKVEKLAASMEGRASSSETSRELQRLSDRVVFVSRVGTALRFIALASIAVARFL